MDKGKENINFVRDYEDNINLLIEDNHREYS